MYSAFKSLRFVSSSAIFLKRVVFPAPLAPTIHTFSEPLMIILIFSAKTLFPSGVISFDSSYCITVFPAGMYEFLSPSLKKIASSCSGISVIFSSAFSNLLPIDLTVCILSFKFLATDGSCLEHFTNALCTFCITFLYFSSRICFSLRSFSACCSCRSNL